MIWLEAVFGGVRRWPGASAYFFWQWNASVRQENGRVFIQIAPRVALDQIFCVDLVDGMSLAVKVTK